jgi:methylenetetrahydrofolate dehydrogenase (NADP+)/methenyltetrahydrofolate cyclohydrolase
MSAQLMDGNALSQQMRVDFSARTQSLISQGTTPGLAVILVGDNAASQVYVRNKVKACEQVGIRSVLEKYPEHLSEADLLDRVDKLNHFRLQHCPRIRVDACR